MNRTTWHLRVNAGVIVWLTASVVVTVVSPFVAEPRWLIIHLLLLGAVTNAILVWTRHFSEALLHVVPSSTAHRWQGVRLAILNVGVIAVVIGVMSWRWWSTLVGAVAVAVAVVWHGLSLFAQARAALPSRFGATVGYYVVAATALPIGAGLGAMLAHGPGDPLHERIVVAHADLNLLGWVTLTVVGTLVTLWPTMLRTRIADGAEHAAQYALAALSASIVVIAAAAVAGITWAVAAGIVGYLVGLAIAARPLLIEARQRPPSTYATWSVMGGLCWLAGSVGALLIIVVSAPSWMGVGSRIDALTTPLAAGFAIQVLLGALSYLAPVMLGGGPGAVRVATATLALGGEFRITLINGGLLVTVLPVPSIVRAACSGLVLVGLAAFLPLLAAAVRASLKAKAHPPPVKPPIPPAAAPRGRQIASAAAALGVIVLAVAIGVVMDSAAPAGGTKSASTSKSQSTSSSVTPTGKTTRAEVNAGCISLRGSRSA